MTKKKTRRMRIECWVTKATETHPEYVILVAFPRQQLFTRTPLSITLYTLCLSNFFFLVDFQFRFTHYLSIRVWR